MGLEFLSPLHRAVRQIGLSMEPRIASLGVNPGEGHLLSYLAAYGPCSIGEIHRVFGLSRSTLTSVVDRLEGGGLLRRRQDPSDRRSLLLDLTPRGRRATKRINAVVAEFESALRQKTTAAERRGFARVLAAVADVTGIEVRKKEES